MDAVWPYLAAILPTILVAILFYFLIKSMLEGDRREHDGLDEDALLDQSIAEAAGSVGIAHHDRRDRRLRGAGIESQTRQLGFEGAGVRP